MRLGDQSPLRNDILMQRHEGNPEQKLKSEEENKGEYTFKYLYF